MVHPAGFVKSQWNPHGAPTPDKPSSSQTDPAITGWSVVQELMAGDSSVEKVSAEAAQVELGTLRGLVDSLKNEVCLTNSFVNMVSRTRLNIRLQANNLPQQVFFLLLSSLQTILLLLF